MAGGDDIYHISIHTPARGATLIFLLPTHNSSISIHTPARGATTAIAVCQLFLKFQSTLPRGERLHVMFPVTGSKENFNPHSREGSDPTVARSFSRADNFNPHSREGSDLTTTYMLSETQLISIHTPARGATLLLLALKLYCPYFNPHSREGSDYLIHYQSRAIIYFNPHSREGSDSKIAQKQF